ncbi:hypothetical protein ACQEVC_23810 [Plantactinospora sp. CA-294935]|uniref:hypothetical protein n=1 Tax=Plantactinospora sp. CA-294935 TaxID=3240012 RepID=UPI003D8F3921
MIWRWSMPESPVKDKNYNLVTVLQMSLENSWRMDNYIEDAEREGDAELAEWFRKVRENSKTAGEQGKRMLTARLQRENG